MWECEGKDSRNMSKVNRACFGGKWKTFCAWQLKSGVFQPEKENTGIGGENHTE